MYKRTEVAHGELQMRRLGGLVHHTRSRASSSISRTGVRSQVGNWRSLPASERAAWELLGWTEAKWTEADVSPVTALQTWDELSSEQQAAAQHGLGWNRETWDRTVVAGNCSSGLRASETAASHPGPACGSASAPSAPQDSSAGGASFAQSAWSAVKAFAPVVGKAVAEGAGRRNSGLGFAVGAALAHLGTVLDVTEGMTEVRDAETCVYLDDSQSMTWGVHSSANLFGTRLEEGKRVLQSLRPLIDGPTRVVKFGSHPTVVATRQPADEIPESSLQLQWDGSSGATYMWKMIEEDVVGRYTPSGGKLRIVVVTDGEDTRSPGEYQGMSGMDPMMRYLQERGYDIEWHIVVIGDDIARASRNRYASLAAATGGGFLAVDAFDARDPKAQAFLRALAQSGGEREQRRRQYEIDAQQGKRERFDWYKALPRSSTRN